MQDISTIIKNNPTAFSNNVEISKNFCCYSQLNEENYNERISYPKNKQLFQYPGLGGVPIVYDENSQKVYVDNSDKHTVVIGQTGSKKSRLIAMPTVRILGAAGESMIISDPKSEIFNRTFNYLKKQHYDIKVIDLRNPNNGNAWNPFSVAYSFYKSGDVDHAYEFLNDISINLTEIDKSSKEAFWDNSAGSLFFGLSLILFKYCLENNEPDEAVNIKNILELRNSLFETDRPILNPIWTYAKSDRFIESILIGTVATAVETRAGILSVFDQKMRAFSVQPSLLSMLSHNDNSFDHLTEKRSAVFLLLPDEKTGFHNLVSLYVKQSYEYLIYKAQHCLTSQKSLGIRVNYILDEFSSLPEISDFPAMITAARSRNIRFNLFLQSKKQLQIRYGEDCDTIMSNCENWFYLSSREIGFLKELSELCGECNGSSRKPLLSISDLQRLNKRKGQVLILTARNKPIVSYLPDIDFYDQDSNHHINNPIIITHSFTVNEDNDFFNRFIQFVITQQKAKLMENMETQKSKKNEQEDVERTDNLKNLHGSVVEVPVSQNPHVGNSPPKKIIYLERDVLLKLIKKVDSLDSKVNRKPKRSFLAEFAKLLGGNHNDI